MSNAPIFFILVVIVIAAIFVVRRLANNSAAESQPTSTAKPAEPAAAKTEAQASNAQATPQSSPKSSPQSRKEMSEKPVKEANKSTKVSKDVDPVIDSADKSQPSPLGAEVPDEVKEPLIALDDEKDPLARHRLYQQITETSYRNRADEGWRAICKTYSARHIKEFADLQQAVAAANGGNLPQVTTFQNYATLLVEDGKFDQAITVCEQALAFGLDDKTKTGFAGRIERIQKQKAKAAS